MTTVQNSRVGRLVLVVVASFALMFGASACGGASKGSLADDMCALAKDFDADKISAEEFMEESQKIMDKGLENDISYMDLTAEVMDRCDVDF